MRFNQVRLNQVNGIVYDAAGNTGWVNFFYDENDNQLLRVERVFAGYGQEYRANDGGDMILQLRPNGQWARYVHGPSADQPLAMELYPAGATPVPGTGQQFYYHADAEGSIRLMSDATGQVANRYDYDSYGKRLNVVESVSQPYTWKAREFFSEFGMYYNRARWYDPQLGRFTSEDPLEYGGGDSNLYAFTGNNPWNWDDPSGLCPSCEYGGQSSISQTALLGGGVVARAGAFATRVGTAATLAAGNLATLSTIAGRIACAFYIVSDAIDVYNDPNAENIINLAVDAAECGVKPRFGKPMPKPRPPTTCKVGSPNSFGERVLSLLERLNCDYILGLAINNVLAERSADWKDQCRYKRKTPRPVVRRFHQFNYAAKAWSRERKVIARVEATSMGADARFIVTNLPGRGKVLYEKVYCARGAMENLIKDIKLYTRSDKTACNRWQANQFRLFLHMGAYWLLHLLRRAAPPKSIWRGATFETIRRNFVKVAVRIEELKSRIRLALPASYPFADDWIEMTERITAAPS